VQRGSGAGSIVWILHYLQDFASRDVPGLMCVDQRCRTSIACRATPTPAIVSHRVPPTRSISMDYATHFEKGAELDHFVCPSHFGSPLESEHMFD
jgi:hypothetical protein